MNQKLLPIGLLLIAALIHFHQNPGSVPFNRPKPHEDSRSKTQSFPKDNSKVPNLKSENEVGTKALEIIPSEDPLPQTAWTEIQRCFAEERLFSSQEPTAPALSLTQLVTLTLKENFDQSAPFLHWENFHLETPEAKEIRVRNLPSEHTIQLFTLDSEGLPEKISLPVEWQILPRESQLEEALKLGRIKTHQRSFSISSHLSGSDRELEWEEENKQVLQASIRINKSLLGCTQFACGCK